MIFSYEDIANSFENGTIEPKEFNHATHVGVAFEMLQRYDFVNAIAVYSKNLRIVAQKAGEPQKFNTTVTIAFMTIIAAKMRENCSENSGQFLQDCPELLNPNVLAEYYSTESIASDVARNAFVFPDIQPLSRSTLPAR